MKTTLIVIIVYCFSFPLFSQSSYPILQGSWITVKAEGFTGQQKKQKEENHLGLQFHFLDKNRLILENENGYYLTRYKQQQDTLKYNAQNIVVEYKNDTLKLYAEYPPFFQKFTMYLVSIGPISSSTANALFYRVGISPGHGLRVDGVYRYFMESIGQYRFLRFFPDGSYINVVPYNFHPPQYTFHTINKAYKLKTMPVYHKHESSGGPTFSYTDGYVSREERKNNIKLDQHFYVMKDSICQNLIKHNANTKDTLSNTSITYHFYKFEGLSSWYPKPNPVSTGNPYHKLLIPKPKGGWQSSSQSNIIIVAEEMPYFAACKNATKKDRKTCSDQKLDEYIRTNLRYPEEAKTNKQEGTGVVQFFVETDGALSEITIAKTLGYGMDEEMVRLIHNMNVEDIKWVPGKQRGKPVKVRISLPIEFKL